MKKNKNKTTREKIRFALATYFGICGIFCSLLGIFLDFTSLTIPCVIAICVAFFESISYTCCVSEYMGYEVSDDEKKLTETIENSNNSIFYFKAIKNTWLVAFIPLIQVIFFVQPQKEKEFILEELQISAVIADTIGVVLNLSLLPQETCIAVSLYLAIVFIVFNVLKAVYLIFDRIYKHLTKHLEDWHSDNRKKIKKKIHKLKKFLRYKKVSHKIKKLKKNIRKTILKIKHKFF
jgi:hypothetical protein